MNTTETPSKLEEEPRPYLAIQTKCPTCKSSRQLIEPVPGTLLKARRPFWGCTNDDSPNYGFWLMYCASCDLHELDAEKLKELTTPRPKIAVPTNAIRKRLRKL